MRDRAVEVYFWALGVYHEPKYSFGRIFLSKVLLFAAIIDDTYDAYGIHEELEIFTQAVKRYTHTRLLHQYMSAFTLRNRFG